MDFEAPADERVQPQSSQGGFVAPSNEIVPPDEGALSAAWKGAVRNFPMAQQAGAATDPGNYSDNIASRVRSAEAAKAAHPWAYGAGAVAGSVAPAFLPGVGEALEAEPVIGNAIAGAAQGIADTDILKNPGTAAGQAGIGGVIGGAMGAAGKYLQRAKPAVSGAEEAATAGATSEAAVPILKEVAPQAEEAAALEAPAAAAPATRSIGPVTEIDGMAVPYKPVAPDYSPTADRIKASQTMIGIGGTPQKWLRVFKGKDVIQEANKINGWLSTAGEGGKSLVGIFDRPGELLNNVQKIHTSAGEEIGNIIKSVAPTIQVSKDAILPELQGIADKSFMNERGLKAVTALMDKLTEGEEAGKLDFESFQKLKEIVGEEAGQKDAPQAVKDAYGVMARYMNDAVDAYGQKIADPKMLARYNVLKESYKNSSSLLTILNYQEARELMQGAKGGFSLRSLLAHIVQATANPEQIGRNLAIKTAPMAGHLAEKIGAPLATAAKTAAAPVTAAGSAISPHLNKAAQLELTNALTSRFGKRNPLTNSQNP